MKSNDEKSDFEKYKSFEEYCYLDEDILEIHVRANDLCHKLNLIPQSEPDARLEVMKELFAKIGENPSIKSNFNCDFGENIYIGDNLLSNYNLTILDCAPVRIGDNCMIGPNVGIYTASHPMTAKGRRDCLVSGTPITIGDDVWIGGNVAILPGVTIGNNVIIGAGSVVNSDIEDNSIAVGNPAKVIKKLEEEE